MNDERRAELIALCERGVVPEQRWHDRDSASSQIGLGTAWALLRAGCDFTESDSPKSDDKTIWIRIQCWGFDAFESGDEYRDDELFYIPTAARLDASGEGDWY